MRIEPSSQTTDLTVAFTEQLQGWAGGLVLVFIAGLSLLQVFLFALQCFKFIVVIHCLELLCCLLREGIDGYVAFFCRVKCFSEETRRFCNLYICRRQHTVACTLSPTLSLTPSALSCPSMVPGVLYFVVVVFPP